MSASDKIARLRELRAKATGGTWHHVNAFKSVPAERTIHGPVPGQRVDYVSTWPHLGTPKGHSVVIPMYGSEKTASSSDMAAIVAAMNSLESLLECASVLELLVTSIDAAQFEGLHDAIANEDAERMKDLLTRRILHHEHDARAALQALAGGGE
jgi:hypothetical protein